ncbi:hypothetical protein HJFPF1_08859 [Paramyrothecium foliicola]|nr:hypothetical protein HJFPF1_08859 [Paramyrothecium foliicola]
MQAQEREREQRQRQTHADRTVCAANLPCYDGDLRLRRCAWSARWSVDENGNGQGVAVGVGVGVGVER